MSKKDWRYIGAVTVCDLHKRRYQFGSLEEAVTDRNMRYYIPDLKLGRLGYPSVIGLRDTPSGGDSHVFYDELGFIIPVWRVKQAFYNLPPKLRSRIRPRWWTRYPDYDHDRHYRNGSVPGVHCRRYTRGTGSPRLHTQAEIRENDFLNNYDEECAEYHIETRGRRRRLPHQWDDPIRGRQSNGWKEHRHNQWR